MNKMKKIGLTVFAALAISLMGQVAFAGTLAQEAIKYNFKLPATGSLNTGVVVKTNTDSYAENYVSYLGWAGSGIDFWMTHNGSRVSEIANFAGTGNTRADYIVSETTLKNQSIGATMKTDSSTWHACNVEGKIYP
ncbi:hypothetical protein Sgly_0836 [Syntrophobotulus glycolicus DSM 8271]|uniref:Uncharacterized protein n=1 Tax=Syntrophobotulus glycolicus (strain DSM 8271 / FlGlyR) TaxID=645991 RepID=F0T1C2_SYNGF|nr:hypothetical protein [Syntrophobotulus glycolicus]ADY55186.1 hypothetical protein Sgly_0836 [Syntrophobotulus glycolicus DSM 8271]